MPAPKEISDFRFEASDDPTWMQMHLTDIDGNTVTYQLPTVRMGRFLGGQFGVLEAIGCQMQKDGIRPQSNTELAPDGLYNSQPTWVDLAESQDGAKEPVIVMHYGAVAISFQINRTGMQYLLKQARQIY